MALFKTRPVTFEKTAAAKLLGEAPDQWSQEILAQLYSQHSYLGSYKVDLQIQGQDEEKGYLYGYFLVSQPQQEPEPGLNSGDVTRPSVAMEEQQTAQGGDATVRIPVIVKSRRLFSIDVMIDGQGVFQPLTEERLSQSMANPEMFEATRAQPTPTQQSGEYTPPSTQGMAKAGSLLAGVHLSEATREAFLAKIDGPELLYALDNNPAFRDAVGKVYKTKTAGAEVSYVTRAKMFLPATASVLEQADGGYLLRSANASAYEPEELFISREDADLLPSHLLPALQKEGNVLISIEAPHQADETEFSLVKEAGTYAVATKAGDVEEGYVIPQVYDYTGSPIDLQLYLGPHGYDLQEKIAGAHLGNDLGFFAPTFVPRGEGVFASPDGQAATMPITLTAGVASGKEHYLLGETELGPVRIKTASHLQRPFGMGRDTCVVPDTWKFIPTGQQTLLQTSPYLAKHAAAMSDKGYEVVLRGRGEYSFSGGCGVDSLPTTQREGLSVSGALLMLGCLGFEDEGAREKLAQADIEGQVVLHGGREICSFSSRFERSKVKVASQFAQLRMTPVHLIKEAAVLGDETAVDTVLALGFLTPDNIEVFLQGLDTMEETVRKLAELLISARLGLQDVQDTAVERAMSGVDKTISGLKAIQVRLQSGDGAMSEQMPVAQ